MNAGAGERFVITGNLDSGLIGAKRCRGDRGHPAAQRGDGRAAVRMHAIGEQDDVSLAERIDPHRGPRETGESVGADREQFTAIGRKRRVDIPPQPSQDGLIRRRLRSGELFHRQRAENPHAFKRAFSQHHAGEPGQIDGGGKQPGMPCDAAHESSGRIVHHASERREAFRRRFGRSDAAVQTGGRLERGVLHPQRLENSAAGEIGECLPAQPAHDFSQ